MKRSWRKLISCYASVSHVCTRYKNRETETRIPFGFVHLFVFVIIPLDIWHRPSHPFIFLYFFFTAFSIHFLRFFMTYSLLDFLRAYSSVFGVVCILFCWFFFYCETFVDCVRLCLQSWRQMYGKSTCVDNGLKASLISVNGRIQLANPNRDIKEKKIEMYKNHILCIAVDKSDSHGKGLSNRRAFFFRF